MKNESEESERERERERERMCVTKKKMMGKK